MAYRYDTTHLTGQQRAIINQRDRNNELLKKSSEQQAMTVKLSEEQINFLTRLKVEGPQHYSILGDRLGNDEEAIKQLNDMKKERVVHFDGVDASVTEKGLEFVKGRDSYLK